MIFKEKVQVWICYHHSIQNQFTFLVLLTREERGAFWQPVTGSVENGETLQEAACREVREETGFELSNAPSPIGIPFEFDSRWGQRVKEFPFFSVLPDQGEKFPSVKIDSHEHVGFRWVDGQEALKMISYPSNIEVLKFILEYFEKGTI